MDRQEFFPTMTLANDVKTNGRFFPKQKKNSLAFSFHLVHSADLERIETTFRDLTSGTGDLSYTSFKRDVFAQFLPEKLAAV